jgi:hypothetical protein
MGFGLTTVSSDRRLPSPPARITTLISELTKHPQRGIMAKDPVRGVDCGVRQGAKDWEDRAQGPACSCDNPSTPSSPRTPPAHGLAPSISRIEAWSCAR